MAMTDLTYFSNSEMALFQRCPRWWLIRYYYGFVPTLKIPTGTSQLGIRIHTALEGLYGYGADPLKVLDLLYRTAIEEGPEFEPELRKEWDLGRAMITGYMEWVLTEAIDADWKVVATEEDVRVPLIGVPGAGLRARFDETVQQISTGFWFFLDFKTAASFEKHELLRLDPQFKRYAVISHMRAGVDWTQPHPDFAPVVGGGVIRTLRRVKRTERAQPPFYRTDPFRYAPEELTAELQHMQGIASRIMAARHTLDWAYGPNASGDLALVNKIQRRELAPVPIVHDCAWRCELASGLCTAMDDGSDWPGMLERSGRWERGDPYAHYERGGIASIRDQLDRL
jgi:hypothetical protein